MITKKITERMEKELEEYKKKGFKNEQILKLYSVRYGIPYEFMMNLYEFLLENK